MGACMTAYKKHIRVYESVRLPSEESLEGLTSASEEDIPLGSEDVSVALVHTS